NHAKTASWRIRILPVGNAGHGCTDCAGYTNGHGGVGCGGELVAATHYLQPVANECCCPSTDGHISEYCVQGMPHANTVQEVFELLTAGTRTRESFMHQFLQFFFNCLVFGDSSQSNPPVMS